MRADVLRRPIDRKQVVRRRPTRRDMRWWRPRRHATKFLSCFLREPFHRLRVTVGCTRRRNEGVPSHGHVCEYAFPSPTATALTNACSRPTTGRCNCCGHIGIFSGRATAARRSPHRALQDVFSALERKSRRASEGPSHSDAQQRGHPTSRFCSLAKTEIRLSLASQSLLAGLGLTRYVPLCRLPAGPSSRRLHTPPLIMADVIRHDSGIAQVGTRQPQTLQSNHRCIAAPRRF